MDDEYRVFCLPHNEWGFLLGILQILAEDLDQAVSLSKCGKEVDELSDLLLVANTLIGYIDASDSRKYVKKWHDQTRARLEELKA